MANVANKYNIIQVGLTFVVPDRLIEGNQDAKSQVVGDSSSVK
jgi:hypothetical protein